MNVMTKTRLEVVPLTKHIGAEIRGIDLREKPDDATVKAIYQAWLDHLVIIFPDQKLSQEDLLRATTFFGHPDMKNYTVEADATEFTLRELKTYAVIDLSR